VVYARRLVIISVAMLSLATAQHRVLEWLATRPAAWHAACFVADTYRAPRVFLLGGTVRDVLLGRPDAAGDVDIVVEGISRADYDDVATRMPHVQRTYFGAHSVRYQGAMVDVLRMDDMINIIHYHLAPTMPNVVATVPLNLDAIAFDVTGSVLHDSGCIAGINDRTVRFRTCTPAREHINAIRCLRLKNKFAFGFDDHTTALVARVAKAVRARPELRDDAMLFLAKHDVSEAASLALLEELDSWA
jgi:hypothetical protein